MTFSKIVEIIPPSGKNMKKFYGDVEILKETGVKTVSVVSNPMGKSKLPALYIAQYLMDEGFKVIVHYPLSGRSEVIIKSDVLQAVSMGVGMILVLSGDSHGTKFESGMNIFDVIKLVRSYDILAGVAVSSNKIDHKYLKAKVDAGANYFQTQPVFTANDVLILLKEIQKYCLPIYVGVMIPKSKKHLERLLQIPGIVIPDAYLKSFDNINTEEDFIENAFIQARKVVEMVEKALGNGVYLSMPQSLFKYIGEKI